MKIKLIIFDLDQTLVNSISTHNKATEEVFRNLFGVKARLTEIDFTGKGQIENLIELAKFKNLPEDKIRKNSKKVLKKYEKYFIENFPKKPSRYILPGVKKVLEKLSKTENILALYTGSSKNVSDKILTATDLKKYFKFSMNSTKIEVRTEMIKFLIKKSERLSGQKFRGKDIVVIGDSIRDIDCGKKFNALTIAVATGFHSKEELLKHKPDYLFNNMKNYNKILKAIE